MAAETPSESSLLPWQKHVFDDVKKGLSVAMLGPGGSGKTFLMDNLALLPGAVMATMSNRQAVKSGCRTFHSCLECSPADVSGNWNKTIPAVCDRLRDRCSPLCSDILFRYIPTAPPSEACAGPTEEEGGERIPTPILLISEFCFMSHQLLEFGDRVLRTLRGNNRPWGGLQIVAEGDPYQLPPISNSDTRVRWVMESPVFLASFDRIVLPTTNKRAAEDPDMCRFLEAVRNFDTIPQIERDFVHQTLRALQEKSTAETGMEFTAIAGRRETVASMNAQFVVEKATGKTFKLPKVSFTIEPYEKKGGAAASASTSSLESHMLRMKTISDEMDTFIRSMPDQVFVGAQVVLTDTINRTKGVVNGLACTVVGVKPALLAGKEGKDTLQADMKTAARANHRFVMSDGLPTITVAFTNPFDHEVISTFDVPFRVVVSRMNIGAVRSFVRDNAAFGTIVHFSKTKTEEIQDCMPANCVGYFPFSVGHAFTVHAVQGQTLERVHIVMEPNEMFGKGAHVYTALSRARSLRALTISGLPPSVPLVEYMLRPNPQVRAFFNALGDRHHDGSRPARRFMMDYFDRELEVTWYSPEDKDDAAADPSTIVFAVDAGKRESYFRSYVAAFSTTNTDAFNFVAQKVQSGNSAAFVREIIETTDGIHESEFKTRRSAEE